MFDEEKLAWHRGLEKMKHYLIVSGGSEKQLRAERPPTGENYLLHLNSTPTGKLI